MLYTQSQLISFATYCLKNYGLKDPNGGDLAPSHAALTNWEDKNNIQPIQVGQPITITTLDGISITADISSITNTETNVAQNTL